MGPPVVTVTLHVIWNRPSPLSSFTRLTFGTKLLLQQADSSISGGILPAMKPALYSVSILLLSVLIVLLSVTPGGDGQSNDSGNCCSKLNVPDECHFLCGSGSSPGFWTVTRWKCTHKYYAKIVGCEFTSAINYVKVFGEGLTQTIKAGFDKLGDAIKAKLISAKEFAKATIDELKQVPQDVLCALKESLAGMTSSQFGGLIQRFKEFTAQNIRQLVSSVQLQTIFDNIGDLARQDWDKEQMNAFIKAGYRKFGQKVQVWGKEAFATLKQLLAGLESGELATIAADKFKEVTQYLCSAQLSSDQKKALLEGPAKAAYGEVNEWTEDVMTNLCDLIEALPIEDVLKLSSKVVAKLIKTIANVTEFSYPHAKALILKVKAEYGGDIQKWTVDQLKNLGKFIKNLDANDLKQLLSQQFKAILSTLGEMDWDSEQARQLALKAIEFLGKPDQWTAENLKDMGKLVAGLLPSEIRQIGNSVLKSGLKAFKNVKLEIDQAQEVVDKVKTELRQQLQNIDKDDLVSLAKAVDGFLSSDIGRMSQAVVFAAFPELAIAKQVAMPILRELIKIYEKDGSSQKSLGMLGMVATGLSRSEIDDAAIESIVNNLDKVGAIPWDKTQVIELAKRIRVRWGSINDTDNSLSDTPNWGFLNLKKLGRVALGLAKEELRVLPIRGIEDVIEVLGKQKDWDRGQVSMVVTRLREYWQMEDLDFSNFTELDINSLGRFVLGLNKTELDNLPERVLLIALRRLGDETGIPEDKLKARAYQAVELFKKQTGVDVLNASHIQDMGNLVAGMSRTALRKISKDAFVQNLYAIARAKGFDDKKLKEIARLAKQYVGDVSKWSIAEWRDLGPAIVGLEPSDLKLISRDAFEELINDLGGLEFTEAQASALITAAKKIYQESEISRWSGERLRKLGSLAKGLNFAEILQISKEGFEEAVGVWGKQLNIDVSKLKAMAALAKNHLVNGNVTKLTASQLKKLGRVVLGLEPADLEKFNLDSIDGIEALGKLRGWTNEQLEMLKPKVKTFLANNAVKMEDIYMSLGQLATVLSKEDIANIPKKAFSLALKQLGEQEWSDEQMKAIVAKAKTTWLDSVDNWDKARISELGNAQRGFSSSDIPKLQPEVVDAIKPEVISSLSTDQLKSFTPAQFSSMESPQVAAISMARRSQLSSEQRSAIQTVLDTDPIEDDPWGPDDDCPGHTCGGTSLVPLSLLSILGTFMAAFALSWW